MNKLEVKINQYEVEKTYSSNMVTSIEDLEEAFKDILNLMGFHPNLKVTIVEVSNE